MIWNTLVKISELVDVGFVRNAETMPPCDPDESAPSWVWRRLGTSLAGVLHTRISRLHSNGAI